MTQAKPYQRLGKFELHDLIGEGAMGVVWKAYDSVLRRYVALKLLPTKVSRAGDVRERFLREARAAGVLQHRNIVTIYDLGEAESQLFIAMELVDGRDLSTIVAVNEPLPLERKLDIVIEVLEALAYAHSRGVIHRDIKPSNVRIATDGGIKIMDFGIARLQSGDPTASGAIVGTPSYMAPEQITNGPIGPATDLFAAGCLLYELLSYRRPFEAETIHGVLYQVLTTDPRPLRTTAPSIPAALERVVGKAMNKVPEDRYQSAQQMQSALLGIRAALSGPSLTTQRLGPGWSPIPAPVLRLVSHAPLRWRVAVLTALVVVVGLLVLSRNPAPTARLTPAAVTLDGLLAEPLPGALGRALLAQRNSARAARARAQLVGATKNSVSALALAETALQNAEHQIRLGDQSHATNSYLTAIGQYALAERQAEALRREAEAVIVRARPVVLALGTGLEASRAATSLARAESLFATMAYPLARIAALDAEQVGLIAGVAPPTPQPAEPRAAINVLLRDLERAVASERVPNLRVLMSPVMALTSVAEWEAYFGQRTRLSARYRVQQLSLGRTAASAVVQAEYSYVPEGGGALRRDRPRLAMRFAKTPEGWRIGSVRCVGSCR
jgi:predicted Ser/Thr protein kinase